MKCEVKRSMLNKDVQKVVEFMIEYSAPPKADFLPNGPLLVVGSGPASGGKPIKFLLTPDSLQNVKDVSTTVEAII